MTTPIRIAGAGPAGLSAALTVTAAGRKAAVYEQRADVGVRFHGDYQGLENWSTEQDVLEELASIGIEPVFEHAPVRELVLFDPWGRMAVCRSARPLFYLVRRGRAPGTLDDGLRRQALARGVALHFDHRATAGQADIIAGGPQRPNVIAVGYLFDTDMTDGVYAAVSDRLAPKGYVYLLVHGGRGTLAACLFDRFAGRNDCLERSVEFFKRQVGLRMRNVRRFGGVGEVGGPVTRGALCAGEYAGFQDTLFGFGIRYAVISGHLAARAAVDGRVNDFERMWAHRLGPQLRTAVVNRFLYRCGGHPGYAWLVWRVCRARDPRRWLRGFYGPSVAKSVCLPLAGPASQAYRRRDLPAG